MNRDRKIKGQRRIIVGFARLAVITIFVAQISVVHLRADEPAAAPLKVVVANVAATETTGSWTTSALAVALSGSTETAHAIVTDCVGGGWPLTISPDVGAAYTADLAYYLCNKTGFHLLDAPTNVDVSTVMTYKNGATQASFPLSPIGAVTHERSSSVGPVINVGEIHPIITTFAPEPTPMRATLYGGDYLFIPYYEDFTANAKVKVVNEFGAELWVTPPVSQYQLKASGVYFLSISIRPCNAGPCPVFAPVYGFVSDGTLQGGTLRPFPFGK